MKKISVNLITSHLAFFLTLFLILYFTFGGNFYSTVLDGTNLFIACIFPSMLPYLFFTAFLTSNKSTTKIATIMSPLSKKVFRTNGYCFFCLFLSLISGYPMGAKTVSDLKLSGFFSSEESVRASVLCSTSSPSFLIGSIGGIAFNNVRFGLAIFLTHVISCFINGFLFSFYKRKSPATNVDNKNFSSKKQTLYDVSLSSVLSVFAVGGIIILFYLLTEMLSSLHVVSFLARSISPIAGDTSTALVKGILETTGGFKSLSFLPISPSVFSCACFMIGFGGLSVIIQSLAFLKSAKIKTAPFILSKITCGLISIIVSIPIYAIFF